ncbi:MAG: ABC transporter ATP-binding protein [Chloroflexota bacterium]
MVKSRNDGSGRVTFEKVTKRYALPSGSDLAVIQGIDLEVAPHEIVGLIGPSGCGKTTLLRLVAGLEEPSGGRLLVDGKSDGEICCERTFMSQAANLFPWRTVRGNIAFGLEARKKRDGISDAFIRERVAHLVEMVELEGFEDTYPHQLSGGMAQRTALARALANEPAVLLLDEPFGSLDAFTKIALQEELLKVWKESPRTIIFVTHDIDEAVFLADRIAIMSPRPGHIKDTIAVPLAHPRDRMDLDFLRIKEKIFQEFKLRVEKPFIVQI